VFLVTRVVFPLVVYYEAFLAFLVVFTPEPCLSPHGAASCPVPCNTQTPSPPKHGILRRNMSEFLTSNSFGLPENSGAVERWNLNV
jgi:hypothetical protein